MTPFTPAEMREMALACESAGWYQAAAMLRFAAGQIEVQTKEIARLTTEIDLAWFDIEHGYDIEPRSYFEREAPKNGFKSALAQAVHHMWKRDPKVAPLAAQIEAQEQALNEIAIELHAAINEPMYAGTRKDWIDRAYAAETQLSTLREQVRGLEQTWRARARQLERESASATRQGEVSMLSLAGAYLCASDDLAALVKGDQK